MIIRIKKKILKRLEIAFWILLMLSLSLIGVTFSGGDALGLNITNQSVLAKVNITATTPDLYRVVISSPATPIDLTANGATVIVCNGSIYDNQGYTDIVNVSATFYRINLASNAPDDNSTHYTNSSCGNCTTVPGTGNLNGSCPCQFTIQYYAEPGLWRCNLSVNDSAGLYDFENSTAYTVNEVIGIAVENPILDYGNMSVMQTSLPMRENVTNTGNIPINITLRGYGGDNETIGQNVSMICEAGTNITFEQQRYYPGSGPGFDLMYNLSNQTRQIFNLTIPKRTRNDALGNSSNSTFWRLQIPAAASGVCNGTIIFGAYDALNN